MDITHHLSRPYTMSSLTVEVKKIYFPSKFRFVLLFIFVYTEIKLITRSPNMVIKLKTTKRVLSFADVMYKRWVDRSLKKL